MPVCSPSGRSVRPVQARRLTDFADEPRYSRGLRRDYRAPIRARSRVLPS